ncbi:MAG TPA: alpha/beta hydrolase [Nocardioides sp.]|nr:alpha/beta hydrolase [Nocardioides sp.]
MFSTVTLREGRTLEYVDLGDPAGPPVLFFSGTPATGGQARVIVEAVERHGVRVVGPSRPGYGASTLTPPSLAATATDTLELADELGLDRFVTLGLSGGGPFALAVAALTPERVTSVAVHAGPAPYVEVKPEVLEDVDRRALAMIADGDVDGAMALEIPLADDELAELRGLSAEDFAAALQKTAPPGPNWFEEHPEARSAFDADFQRAIETSEGYVRDNLSWLGPWDIDLGAVTSPVRLVYGDADGMVPQDHGEWLRERLATSDWHVVPGGHGHATFGAAGDTFAALT